MRYQIDLISIIYCQGHSSDYFNTVRVGKLMNDLTKSNLGVDRVGRPH